MPLNDAEDRLIAVHKAETNPFRAGVSTFPIPNCDIRIVHALPADAEEMNNAIDDDAAQLAEVLATHLPTATFNRMLAIMLVLKAGDLRWPIKQKEGEKDERERKNPKGKTQPWITKIGG